MNAYSRIVTMTVALSLASACAGCDAEVEQVSEACNANAECPLYWSCNRVTNTCEYEADNRFVGTMSCEFTESSSSHISYFGASDIAAWLAMAGGGYLRVTVNAAAYCSYSAQYSGGVVFSASGFDSSGTQFVLQIVLARPAQGAYQLVTPDEFSRATDQAALGVASLYALPSGGSAPQLLGVSAAGLAVIDRDAMVGTAPSMYVDLWIAPQ